MSHEDRHGGTPRSSRGLSRAAVATWLLAVALVVGACGDDAEPNAQPAEDAPVFASGDFGEVPVHPLADPVGEKAETNDVVAQSFRIRNVNRESLFEWYADRLEGWRQEVAPGPVGESEEAAWRGIWERGSRRLIVTVSTAPTLDPKAGADASPVLQYSLSLEPDDRPLPGADSP